MLAQAQPIITQANFNPIPGDRTIFIVCDTNGIFPGGAGANQHWDFSALHVSADADTAYYGVCVDTSFCNHFPACNIIKNYSYGGGLTEFYNSNADSFNLLGTGDNDLFFWMYIKNKPVLKMAYPFTFNSTFYTSTNQTFGDTISEYDTAWCDGYGQLILPGVTYDSALRLHFRSTQYDSDVTHVSIFPFKITKTDSFAWLVPGIHDPVFGICSNKFIFNTGVKFDKRVTISKQYSTAAVKDKTVDMGLNLSPNPSSGLIQISCDLTDTRPIKVTICDVMGQKVIETDEGYRSSGIQNFTIDLSAFPKGIYFVRLRSGIHEASRCVQLH